MVTHRYWSKDCGACGGRTNNAGFAKYSHVHSERHISALRRSASKYDKIMADIYEADNKRAASRRKDRKSIK